MDSDNGIVAVSMSTAQPEWHPGMQSRAAYGTEAVPPPRTGAAVLAHIRDPETSEPDSNVGWWMLPELRGGRVYTFGCQVYVPRAFAGTEVRFCLGEPLDRACRADLSLRDQWQLLSLRVMLPEDLPELGLILRVDAASEAVLYSAAWSVEHVAFEPPAAAAAGSAVTGDAAPASTPAQSPPVAVAPPHTANRPAGSPSMLPAELVEGENFLSLARAMAAGRETPDLALLVSAYVMGACSYFDHQQHQARTLLDEIAHAHAGLARNESLFDQHRGIRRDVVTALCPELLPNLYERKTNAGAEQIRLLEACPNELIDNRLPGAISTLRRQPARPAVTAYASADACLYVHPYRYQVLSKDRSGMWLSGGPRGLSRDAIGATELIQVDKDVVVLQDRFNFSGISHFFLDGISRALLLAREIDDPSSLLFVFGGVPGEFQTLVCEALRARLNLAAEDILFPDRALTIETTRRCIWFSDQTETYLHPAQMAHPNSIGVLRSIIEMLPGYPVDQRRFYFAPADTGSPRLGNADRLRSVLEVRGFVTIESGSLSAAQLIGIFRGADVIVAPHSPELTYLIAADRLLDIVELFPPSSGTDAYSFLAAAGGIRHAAVFGTGNPAAYEIDVEAVVRCIEGRPVWHKAANLLPGSSSLAGFRSEPNASHLSPGIPSLVAGAAVMAHHGGPERQSSLLGRWPDLPLISGVRYTASCWMWIPHDLTGTEVLLALAGPGLYDASAADLAVRGAWQRVTLTATAPDGNCALELRMSGSVAGWFATTCWQIERGDAATAYVATP